MYWKVAAGDLPRWYTLRFEENAFLIDMSAEVFRYIERVLGTEHPEMRTYLSHKVVDPALYASPKEERWGIDRSVETCKGEGNTYILRIALRTYTDERYFACAQSLSLIFNALEQFDPRVLSGERAQLLAVSVPPTLPRKEVYGFSVGVHEQLRALFSKYYFYPMRGSVYLIMNGAAQWICARELFRDEYCAVAWEDAHTVSIRSGYSVLGPRRKMGNVVSVSEWDTLNADDYLTHMTLLAGVFHLYQLALEEEAVEEETKKSTKALRA